MDKDSLMIQKKSTPSLLDKDQETTALSALKTLFEERFDVRLGLFEAKEVLDCVCDQIGALYYNKALKDMQERIHQRFESIEADLWMLEK